MAEGKLGIAVKYELATKMKVTNEVTRDDTGLYVDNEEVTANLPSFLSLGVRFSASDDFRMQAGFHYYGDKSVSYGKKDDKGNYIDNGEEFTLDGTTTTYLEGNSIEVGIGGEYDFSDLFTASVGLLYINTNPNDIYQNDLGYTLSRITTGLGGSLHLSDRFDIDLGVAYNFYDEYEKTLDYGALETYDKTAFIGAIGLTYHMGGN